MRRLITLLAVLTLAVPLMFLGCSGDDGSTGAAGPPGVPGDPGPPGPGVVTEETCNLCHGSGKAEAVAGVHRIGETAGTIDVAITSVSFGAVTDNTVPVTVTFTFAATDSADNPITGIDLGTLATTGSNAGNLAYLQFSLAKLVPGVAGSPAEWEGFVVRPTATGSGPYYQGVPTGLTGGAGSYSYTFQDNTVRFADTGSLDNVVVRAALKISGIPIDLFTTDPYFDTSLKRPVGTAIFDVVTPAGVTGTGTPTNAALLAKNDVSTDACNKCHDPLGIHGGSRREIKHCVVCHNIKTETVPNPDVRSPWDNVNLVNLVHKLHNSSSDARFAGVQNIGELGDFSEVVFPQAINNCTTCHQGPDADNTYDNFKNRPSREACGACHINVNFATGDGHDGGARLTDALCASCHGADDILGYHAAKDGAPPTPNNPTLAGNLKNVEYGISSVTVDNTNAALVKFQIKIDNVVANLGATGDNVARPSGFTGGPSFLLAYTLPQDGVSAPADYNNLGRTAGQPESVSIVGLPITANDNTWTTVKVANAFPAGAKMRAVALQGYFTQTNGIGTDNVARHTPSVMVKVTGDTERRAVAKSGYNATTGKPEGCLECHQVFEGHGGNRLNNVQVCVMCHNPNLTTSGRTYPGPYTGTDLPPGVSSDPLAWPEESNNMKDLIHGIHGAEMRVNPFLDYRLRSGNMYFYDFSEVLYPGDLSRCTKCHVGTTYQNVQVPNALVSTTKITTGNASETTAEINEARASVPNTTDLVNTPGASACGYCHDAPTYVSHFILQGGKVKTERGTATLPLPELAPANP